MRIVPLQIVFTLMAGIALTACGQGTSGDNGNSIPPIANDMGIATDQGQPIGTDAGPLDPPDLRSSRRITVDQLRRSIPLLFGGETWTTRFQQREVEVIDGLARTLGEADFLEVTTPNVEPGPLFQKFMDDMAANLCTKSVTADLSGEGEGLVVRYSDNIDANLRFLRLKFHAIHVPEDTAPEDDGMEELRALYADLAAAHDISTAWIGVCIALVTAPEFLAY